MDGKAENVQWDPVRAVTSDEYREKVQKWLKQHRLDPSLIPSNGYVRAVPGDESILAIQTYVMNPDAPAGILYNFEEDEPVTEEHMLKAELPEELLIEEEE